MRLYMNHKRAISIAQIKRFKRSVIHEATRTSFTHHPWFIKYHLNLVERISLETCTFYPKADKRLVLLLVWFHDYGKIVNATSQHQATLIRGRDTLLSLGFPLQIVKTVVRYTAILDRKSSIKRAPIEVQIVSSADGAAHLVGPFYMLYWKENSNHSQDRLLKENRRKSLVDWNKKIVLLEVRKAFLTRHTVFLEHCGVFPKKFLKPL